MLNQLAQQRDRRLDTRQLEKLARLVGAGDIAGAEDDGLATELLKIRRFGAKCHRLRRMPGQPFRQAHQLAIGALLEGRHIGEQRSEVDLDLMPFGQWLQFTADC